MNITQLQQIVNAALNGGQFSLLVANLQSQDCNTIAGAYLPNLTLTLTSATVQNTSTGSLVTGTGSDLPFQNIPQISINFYLDSNGNAQFSLTANLTNFAGWQFSNSFPPVADSILDSLVYITGGSDVLQLTLFTEISEEDSSPGLFFTGTVNYDAVSGGFATLFGIPSAVMHGPVLMSHQGSELISMEIFSRTGNNLNLNFITLENIVLHIGFESYFAPTGGSPGAPPPAENDGMFLANPWVKLAAEIPFSTETGSFKIPVAMKMTSTTGIYRFSADITDVITATVQNLAVLLKGYSISQYLPQNFRLDNYLKLTELYLDLNPDSQDNLVQSVGINIANASPWTFLTLSSGQTMTADRISLGVSVYQPFTTASLSIFMMADIRFGAAGTLTFAADVFGDWSVAATTPPESPLLLGELVKCFLGAPSGVPEITLANLEFYISGGGWRFAVEAQDIWELQALSTAIERVNLNIEYDSELGVAASIEGLLNIAGVDLFLAAAYPGAGGGWLFRGGTQGGQEIPIGDLMRDAAAIFGFENSIPDFLGDMVITELSVTFDTLTCDFTFHCDGKFPAWEMEALFILNISILQQNDRTYRNTFGGALIIDGKRFDMVFDTAASASRFIASYYNVKGDTINMRNMVSQITSNTALLNLIPSSLEFELKDGLVGWSAPQNGNGQFLFALDWGFGVNLSNLPLVGKYFGTDETLTLAFQVIFASDAFTAEQVSQLSALIPQNTIQFPAQALSEGLTLINTLRFGGQDQPVSLPVQIDASGNLAPASDPQWGTPQNPDATRPIWFDVQKTFGPVYFSRIGLYYNSNNQRIYFFLDASLNAGGLDLSLTALNINTSLTNLSDVKFGLDGLGLEYENGPLVIGGALLRGTYTDPHSGKSYEEYSGAANIRMESFALAAMGAYADFPYRDKTVPSLFLYGQVNTPIVVQPWLTITGFSGGFGYNRALIPPTLAELPSFPFIAEALHLSGGGEGGDLHSMLSQLSLSLPPAQGEYWLAVGISFTTFKMVDTIALLTVAFGHGFQLNVFGLSTMKLPPGAGTAEPLAEVQLALAATYDYESGYLGVSGQLTQNSYLFSRSVRLTGGFAVCTWLRGANAGAFVLTLGGYHPSYKVPKGYPVVPRLGFNWQVDNSLTLKGNSYMALTSGAVMAGMSLEATWQQGSIKAWFITSADFLIAWKPYHYEAALSITVGASYTFKKFGYTKTFTASAGAALAIWGPDFSGTATVDIGVISFDISFGKTKPGKPNPLKWNEFTAAFLPPQPLTIQPAAGIVGKTTGSPRALTILNPAHAAFGITSLLPLTSASYNTDSSHTTGVTGLTIVQPGIAPMNLVVSNGVSNPVLIQLNITLKIGSGTSATVVNAANYLQFVPVYQKVPSALWGKDFSPKLNGPEFLNNALTGFTLSVQDSALTQTSSVPKSNLVLAGQTSPGTFSFQAPLTFQYETGSGNTMLINKMIVLPQTKAKRFAVLHLLGVDAEENLTDDMANMYLDSPMIYSGIS